MTPPSPALIVAVLCSLAVIVLVDVVTAARQLRIALRARVYFEPADVEIRLHAEPGGRRREVLLELAGDAYYRSSVFPIRSDPDAPTLQPPAWYRSVPAGAYVVTATLTDCAPGGCSRRVVLARAVEQLQVLGVGP